MEVIKVIILISGKRKTGKDYICEKLLKIVGNERCSIIRISEPIKSYYAAEKNLNLLELMSDNPYKEQYRFDMIIWSEGVRQKDPGYFCKAACDKAPLKPIWLVSDIRRKTDIKWFKDTYGNKIKTVRITVANEIRKERGFVFTKGVDDVASECDLDDWTSWELNVTNNNIDELNLAVHGILQLIEMI